MITLLDQCSTKYFFLLILSIMGISSVYAQERIMDEPSDGYVIISSRDTLMGVHSCYDHCLTDSDCPQRQRCVAVDNIGQICLSLREGDSPPQEWTVCEPSVCLSSELCARQPGPMLIQTFVEHKRNRGFEVYLIDETVWGGGEGDHAADNIRIWLQDNYILLNLRYVLLIGDPRPSGDVPMRSTRPANNAYQYWADNPVVPTDFYYAELDGEWDLDGDGKLAEFGVLSHQIQMGSPASFHRDDLGDDLGPGGANRDAELAVGRIPFYGNVNDLDHILQKTMDYENTPQEETLWRQSALLAAEGQRRAFFGELIRTEIMEESSFGTYRVYDLEECWDHSTQQDINCISPIDDVPDSLICTPDQVELGINEQRPGFVAWLTHGSGRGAQSVMLQSTVRSLSDEFPFFTFQASCYNSQPTLSDNLSYELLKNGAIGTIGAATVSHGPGSPMPSLVNDAGNAGMAYNYALRLFAEGMSAGEALNDLRRDVGLQNRWWYWKNYLTFNLWGDPSLGIYSHIQSDALDLPDMEVVDMEVVDMEVVDMEVVDMEVVDVEVVDMEVFDLEMADLEMADLEMADLLKNDFNAQEGEADEGEEDYPDIGLLTDVNSNAQGREQEVGLDILDIDSEGLKSSGCQSVSDHSSLFYQILFTLLLLMMIKNDQYKI